MSELRAAKDSLAEVVERHFRKNGRKEGLVRLEVPSPAVDLPRWLAANPGGPRLFWSSRDGEFEAAGIGAAETVGAGGRRGPVAFHDPSEAKEQTFHPRLRRYGGRSFGGDPAPDPEWSSFGASWFVLPRFEISRERGVWRMACTFRDEPGPAERETLHALLEEVRRLRTALPAVASLPAVVGRADSPDRAAWVRGVESILGGIDDGDYRKVVLARRSLFRFESSPDPFLLLRRLREASPAGFHFAFQPGAGATFLGASPERLYRRHRRRIFTEAVAGTRRRGESAREDRAMGDALLESEKDRHEHRIVADTIAEGLRSICVSLKEDAEVSLLRVTRLQHLYQGFTGTLQPGIGDPGIIAALHPTPAVAGSPTEAAVAEIARTEPFHRGWYAGPVGWIGPQGSEFAVAIRSGLLSGARLALYAGAGIVAGSRPLAEWEELENKLAGFVRAIGAP